MEHGYRGLSMRQIAEAVGVSKPALYYHFKDKEELFLAILEHYVQGVEAILVQVLEEGGTAPQRIRRLVEAIFDQPAEQRAIIRLASQEMNQLSEPVRRAFHRSYHEQFIDKIQVIIGEGIERGELRPFDPGVATWSLLGMMFPYFYPDHHGEMPPAALVVEQILSIYLDGIALTGSASPELE
jgi:AcrR family transcriptional regulator